MKSLIALALVLVTSQSAFAEKLVKCVSKDRKIAVIFDEHITPSEQNLGGDALDIKKVMIDNLAHNWPNSSGDSTYEAFSVEVYRYVDDIGNRPPVTIYIGFLDGKKKGNKWSLSFRETEDSQPVALACEN